MIKVIPKVFDILELLAARQGAGLKDIAERTGMKKTTTANILRTLQDLTYVTNDGQGHYRLSEKFYGLSFFKNRNNLLQSAGEAVVRELGATIQEAVVLAVLENNERMTIAEALFTNNGITLETQNRPGELYGTATGRVLLSGLGGEELRQLTQKRGLPREREWPGTTSLNGMTTALEKIRRDHLESMVTPSGEVQALGVPVYDTRGVLRASLGVYLPVARYNGEHKKNVRRELIRAGKKLSGLLDHQTGSQ